MRASTPRSSRSRTELALSERSESKGRYRVILLDVGETLIGPRRSYGAVYAEVLAGLGLSLRADRLDGCIREVSAEMAELIPTGTDRFSYFPDGEAGFWRRFVGGVLGKAGEDPELARRATDPLRDAFKEPRAWRVYTDVTPALDALRACGLQLGVVSNWDSRLPGLLERLGLAGYFAAIGVSHLERTEKPAPLLFRRVLERLGARADQALHVGNSPELDIAGAEAAGIDAVLVDRGGGCDPSHEALSDLRGLPRIAGSGAEGS